MPDHSMNRLNTLLLRNSVDFDLFTNSILLGYIGSISHGTYKPNSIDDKDLMGVIILPDSYYYGNNKFGSRNTLVIQEHEWDLVFYDLRKFIRLLTKANPNVLSLLWIPDNLYLHKTNIGQELINNRDLFSSQLAYYSFCGYAHSQLNRLEKGVCKGYMGEKRKLLLKQYGFDLKNASHLIRLLRMGTEFLETGVINVNRKDANIFLDIKNGKWSLEKVKAEASKWTSRIEYAYKHTILPEQPDYNKINELCVSLIKTYNI
uniref:Putative nucleotidyltransferase n=1 Tax=viral metagenome TaxID=1070528 RepID=A0A6H1ZUR7_9ZZZZ